MAVVALLLAACGQATGTRAASSAPDAAPATGTTSDGSTTVVLSTVASHGTTTVSPASAPAVPETTATTAGSQTPAQRFLAIITPANQLAEAFEATTDAVAKARVLEDLSTGLGLIAVELGSVTWPGPAQAPAARLVVAAQGAETAVNLLLSNPSPQSTSGFTAAVTALSAASSSMRVALRLPPQTGS